TRGRPRARRAGPARCRRGRARRVRRWEARGTGCRAVEACSSLGARGGLGLLALLFVVRVPVAAADGHRAGACDRAEVGGDVALLDRLPGIARLVLPGADLAVDDVVDVVAVGPLVLEVALAGLLRVRPDEAARVLVPLEVEDVAGDGALELAPLVLVLA